MIGTELATVRLASHAGQLLLHPDQKRLFPDQSWKRWLICVHCSVLGLCIVVSSSWKIWVGSTTTTSSLGCQVVTTFSHYSPGLDSEEPGGKRYVTTNESLNCLAPTSSPKLYFLRLFTKITQYSVKKVSAFHRHRSLCPLLESCKCVILLVLFITVSTGKSIGAAEGNNKHL